VKLNDLNTQTNHKNIKQQKMLNKPDCGRYVPSERVPLLATRRRCNSVLCLRTLCQHIPVPPRTASVTAQIITAYVHTIHSFRGTYLTRYWRWTVGTKGARPLHQESGGGWRRDEARPLDRVSVYVSFIASTPPPFPQIDIIGAIMTVWRVWGKIIRSVPRNMEVQRWCR